MQLVLGLEAQSGVQDSGQGPGGGIKRALCVLTPRKARVHFSCIEVAKGVGGVLLDLPEKNESHKIRPE